MSPSRCCRRRSRRTRTASSGSSRKLGRRGVLNHPGITAVYDFGMHDGAPYIVTELLEGETLRARLADGAAAGAQGHRIRRPDGEGPRRRAREGDRPPGPEAREPVPDEGRAGEDPGLRPRQAQRPSGTSTVDRLENGLGRHRARRRARDDGLHGARAGPRKDRRPALGHLRVRDDPLRDALGTAGLPRRHGRRDDHGDPDEGAAGHLIDQRRRSTPGLDRIVRHCLEKNPEERFESARDVAFDLEALSGVSGTSTTTGVRALPAAGKKRPWPALILAAVLGAAIASPFLYSVGKKAGFVEPPELSPDHVLARRGRRARSSRRTARRSSISAAWEGSPFEIFINRPESPSRGRSACLRRSGSPSRSAARWRSSWLPIARGVHEDGPARAHLDRRRGPATSSTTCSGRTGLRREGPRDRPGRRRENRLEYPIGKLSTRPPGGSAIPESRPGRATRSASSTTPSPTTTAAVSRSWIGPARRRTSRLSMRRRRGSLASGRQRDLVHGGGGRINRAVHGVTLSGKVRLVGRVPGISTMLDVSKTGRGPDDQRERPPRNPRPRDRATRRSGELSWLDYSLVTDIRSDGRQASSSPSREREAERRTRLLLRAYRRVASRADSATAPPRAFARTARGPSRSRTPRRPDLPPSDERGRAQGAIARRPRRLQRRLPARREDPRSSRRPTRPRNAALQRDIAGGKARRLHPRAIPFSGAP